MWYNSCVVCRLHIVVLLLLPLGCTVLGIDVPCSRPKDCPGEQVCNPVTGFCVSQQSIDAGNAGLDASAMGDGPLEDSALPDQRPLLTDVSWDGRTGDARAEDVVATDRSQIDAQRSDLPLGYDVTRLDSSNPPDRMAAYWDTRSPDSNHRTDVVLRDVRVGELPKHDTQRCEPGSLCRDAVGECDEREFCNKFGFCPMDSFLGPEECRYKNGPCDVPEFCSGTSPYCPQDTFAQEGTVCREANPLRDICDMAETCDGHNSACPADGEVAPIDTVNLSTASGHSGFIDQDVLNTDHIKVACAVDGPSQGYVSINTSTVPDQAVITSATLKGCRWRQSSGPHAPEVWESSFAVPLEKNTPTWEAERRQKIADLPDGNGHISLDVTPVDVINKTGNTQFLLLMPQDCGNDLWFRRYSTGDWTGDEYGNPPACSGPFAWQLEIRYCQP